MAERKPVATYDNIMRDLKARKFAPVYILMGEEAYFIDRICDYIAENVMAPEERDFNQTILYGADTTAAQVADLSRGYPMMAEYRVVIVKEAQALKSLEPLEKYFENPVPSTILVLCHKNGTIDRRKKVMAKAEAVGVVFESKKRRDNELPFFIRNYLAEKDATIDEKSTFIMTEHIGADLNRLASELDKILISLPEDDRRITPAIIEEQIGVSKDFNAFEFRNAIVDRNIYKANQIMTYFEKNPKAGSIYAFLPMIFNFFQNLMAAYYAPAPKDENAIARYLDLKLSWFAREYVKGMRNYSGRKTLDIISKIREIDAKSKGLDNPSTGAGDLMKELVFFILH